MSHNIQSFVRGKFASVAAMLAAAPSLAIGEEVETVSYYDGWAATARGPIGGNKYVKVSGQTPTEDGGKIIYTSDGNHLRGLFHGGVKPEQFGARGDGTDDYLKLKACNLSGLGEINYAGVLYFTSDTVPFASKTKYRGVRGATVIHSTTPNKPIGCSQSYLSSEGVQPTGYLDIDDIEFRGSIDTVIGQVAFIFRDFYSNIGAGLRFTDCRGGGLHCLTKNDSDVSVTGTLVENRFEGFATKNVGGIAVLMGEDNNNKLTDGYFINVVVGMNETYATKGIVFGSSAGWVATGFHVYDAVVDLPVEFKNTFNTEIDGYIEAFTTRGAKVTLQNSTQISLRMKTVSGVTSGANALELNRSDAYTNSNVTVDLDITHQGADVDINAINILRTDIEASINVNTSGAYKNRVTEIAGLNLNKFGNIKKVNGYTRGRFEDNYVNADNVDYNGHNLGFCSTSNKVAGTFSHSFLLPIMDDFRKTIVDVAIMANSFDDAGPLNAYYVAKAFVSAKVNGTNNWALEVLEVVAPFGFTTNPTITLTQTFSNQATMTIDGTFGGGDDTGVVCCLIPQPFSLVEFPT